MADIFMTDKDKRELEAKISGKSPAGHKHSAEDIGDGIIKVENGGTGASTPAEALKNLGIVRALITFTTDGNTPVGYPEGFNKDNTFLVSYLRVDGTNKTPTSDVIYFKDDYIQANATGTSTRQMLLERIDM